MQTRHRVIRDDIAPHPTEPSQEIVTAVAEAADVDPMELEPLYDVIDSDALDALLENTDESLELSFDYADAHVVVTEDAITVES